MDEPPTPVLEHNANDLNLGLRLETATRTLHGPAGTTTLTAKEHDLLQALIHGQGNVVTRQQLLRAAWNTTRVGASRALDVHIATLRLKLATISGQNSARIHTVRGTGYRLAPAETAETAETGEADAPR